MAVPERPAGLSERPRAQEPLVSDAPPPPPNLGATNVSPGPDLGATYVSGPPPDMTPRGGTAMSAPLAPGYVPGMMNTRPPPPVQMIAPPPKPDRTLLWVGLGIGALVLVAGVVVLLALAVFAATKPTVTSPPASPAPPAPLQQLPPPGPIAAAPAPIPFVANPSFDSKLPCPAGATLHHNEGSGAGAVVTTYCADASGMRDGPSMSFDRKKGGRLVAQETYAKGKREGQAWTFNAGDPTSVAEYRNDLLHGEKLTIGARKVLAREHYTNGQRDGLCEYWNHATFQPTTAQLYKDGVLVGQSP